MSDLISRQAAISAVNTALFPKINTAKDAEKALRALPPAQKRTDERTETHACDCISRAAAIDAARKCAVKEVTPAYMLIDKAEVMTELMKLPSAQPEIIRCKDCKHFEYDHPYIIQGIPVLGHEVCNAWGDGCKTDENGYCFMAERRAYERTD